MSFFSFINHVDRAGVIFTPGTEVVTMEASNLADPQSFKIWRTTASTETLTVNFGADREVDVLCAAILRKQGLEALDLTPDLASTDTIRHRLYDSGGSLLWDSTAVACGIDPQVGYHVLDVKTLNGGTVSAVRTWVIDIVATSRVGDGYFDLGRLWAGETYTPNANYIYGVNFTWEDSAKISRAARSGAEFTDSGAQRRNWNLTFNSLKTADDTAFQEAERLMGVSQQILFARTSTAPLHDEAILCRQVRAGGITQSNIDRYAKSMRLVENL
jgi:hypothetical protein